MRHLGIFLCAILMANISYSGTINVPADQSTIQAGIDATVNGDTVLVAPGTYNENVVIDKSISLIGETVGTTIIDGSNTGDVILVTADSVNIKKMTIRNSGDSREYENTWDAGIELIHVRGCLIQSCQLRENGGAGLALTGSSENTISNSHFYDNYTGIYFYEVDEWDSCDNAENRITHNLFLQNTRQGIRFEHTMRVHHTANLIQCNYFVGNMGGIYMIMSQENNLSYNNFNYQSSYAITLEMCMGRGEWNAIHHNCFMYNNGGGKQALEMANDGVNYWYDTATHEGNFWSDYTGTDGNGDGIGDDPYQPFGSMMNYDIYPMMYVFDQDADSVIDSVDNCINVSNPSQMDSDLDGVGNACEQYACGDSNGDNDVNVGDAVYLINYVFKGGPPPLQLCAGDPNGDGEVNVGDAVYLIGYVFRGGPPPVEGCCP